MDKIECPKCHHKFELTETLAGPLVAAARVEADAAATVRIEAARKQIEVDANNKAAEGVKELLAEQAGFVIEAQRKAHLSADLVAEKDRQLAENNKKLTEAQTAQAEAVRKTRELDEARRELELTVERRVTEGAATVREEARRLAEESIGLRVNEKEQVIAGLQRALEDAQRKATQGSQQNQGEVQELALEAALRAAFPMDEVVPVAKGVLGADCSLVIDGDAGTITFESKRTKSWSEGWVAKLKDDQRAAGASVAVIVTTALPKGVVDFSAYEGIWVTLPRYVVSLTSVLRMALQAEASARTAGQGQETKAGLIYGYMTGPKFKSRIQAVVEAFTTMREDLDSERRAITKQWAKREAQIERVLTGTVGLYGDLQAIAGRSLAEIEGLDLATLAAPKS